MTTRRGDSFGRLLRAEWTKLVTVPSVIWSLLSAGGIILAIAVMISSGSPGTYDNATYVDEFRLVHKTLVGDGTLVARIRMQDHTHPWAMAGIMIKETPSPGAPYATVVATPGHGVRMQSNFTTDVAGSERAAPVWLKAVRVGDTITGYESIDGTAWDKVGTVRLALPQSVHVGLFVTSPGITRILPMRPTMVRTRPGTATFDPVTLTPARPQPATSWEVTDVGMQASASRRDAAPPPEPGQGGVFTLTGSGDIIGQADDGSRIIAATAGTLFAMLPVLAFGALAMTSEYRWRTIRLTLAASPRRGRILAAKAIVVGGSTFAITLVTTLCALLVTQPLLRHNGFRPPVYPDPSLTEPAVLRIVVGTAAGLALLALLGLGLGAILRHNAATISVVAAMVLVPVVAAPFLPDAAATWLRRLTPTAGLSLQQFKETDDSLLLPWAGQPWTGFWVSCAYAVIALGLGYWLLRRRDA